MLTLTLPWPPTVNHYWRHVGPKVLISAAGRRYRREVSTLAGHHTPTSGRLSVHIAAYPPDRRRRDLDNICKALLDSLDHADVYHDDSQIDELRITRGPVVKGGQVDVFIKPMEEEP